MPNDTNISDRPSYSEMRDLVVKLSREIQLLKTMRAQYIEGGTEPKFNYSSENIILDIPKTEPSGDSVSSADLAALIAELASAVSDLEAAEATIEELEAAAEEAEELQNGTKFTHTVDHTGDRHSPAGDISAGNEWDWVTRTVVNVVIFFNGAANIGRINTDILRVTWMENFISGTYYLHGGSRGAIASYQIVGPSATISADGGNISTAGLDTLGAVGDIQCRLTSDTPEYVVDTAWFTVGQVACTAVSPVQLAFLGSGGTITRDERDGI